MVSAVFLVMTVLVGWPIVLASMVLLQWLLMLLIYVATIAGAGLFLLVSQALYEQQLQVAVPGWQGEGDGAPLGVGQGAEVPG